MSQSRTPFPDHGGKKREPTASNLMRLQATQEQRDADRRALTNRARQKLAQARAGAATSQDGAR